MRPPIRKTETQFQNPGVVFQPDTHIGLQKGVRLMVDAIRPTLGPIPRQVSIDRILPGKPPEILDSGATITRRIYQVSGRNADMGAMFVRHMLWKLQEKTGDGTTAAAVIFQSIFDQGIAFLASGGNAMRLRYFLEQGLNLIHHQIKQVRSDIQGKEMLSGYAETVCHDPVLSDKLGEIFEILGPFGRLEIRSGRGRVITTEYVQGIYWEEGLLSPHMMTDPRYRRAVLENGGVLATDLDIVDPEDIVHILELALEAELNGVLLVAKSISDQALSVLLNPPNWEKVKILVVKTPGNFTDKQLPALRDLSILTGGRVVLSQTQMRLKDVTFDDFGAARKIWANADTFGITTGKGDPHVLRDYVEELQSACRSAEKVDEQEKLLKRVGRLRGGSATLWIGALTEQDYEQSKETAERTSRALRAALLDGVVPGGGCTLLSCRQILEEKHHQAVDLDERAAYRILSRAVQEPFRVLMSNAGYPSGEILQKIEQSNFNQVFDLRTRSFANPFTSGLVDAAGVVSASIHSAVSSAALLLTTDVLVHLKNPPERINT